MTGRRGQAYCRGHTSLPGASVNMSVHKSGKPVSGRRLTAADVALLSERENFTSSLAAGAAKRCRWGFPQVLICNPMKKNLPFPTTFWLVCPHITKHAASLESDCGIGSAAEALKGFQADWNEYHKMHARLRLSLLSPGRKKFMRIYRRSRYRSLQRGGVGGICYEWNDFSVKCLHLQMASFLAVGHHPAEKWLLNRVSSWECPDCRCMSDLMSNEK